MALPQYDKPILIVDDDENVCLVLSLVFADEGCKVKVVHSAEDALEEYRLTPADIAIIDIHLPGMNGIDLMSELKKINGDIEVIIITSYASLTTAVSSIRLGAYKYLMKPFDQIENITIAVKHALEKVMLKAGNRMLLAELQIQNEKLQKAVTVLGDRVNRDSLTGIYNHRCFQQEIIKEVARADRYDHQFSMIFFDVDNFKHYYDNNGHPAGDNLLKAMVAVVEQSLRKSDFFARYGGEEFVILLPETTKEAAAKRAENIRSLIEMYPFANQEKQPGGKMTASFGIATFPDDSKSVAEMIEHADSALYQAKDNGRNQLCVWK